MATSNNNTSFREDLTCAICFELFKEPVMLGCMHHFCRRCIMSYWRSIRGPVTCPQCRQEFPNKSCFQTNFLVANLVEKVRACSTSASVRYLEKQIKDCLESQCSTRQAYIKMVSADKEKMKKIQKVGTELKMRVHNEFQALHHFLKVEEEAMMEELSREYDEMTRELKRHLEALDVAIGDVEKNINTLRQTSSSTEQSLPKLNSGAPVQELNINMNRFRSKCIAPIQYIIWRKMIHHLNPGPAPLVFDEDTAHPSLQLSRSKTQVMESDQMTSYMCDSKRFLQCVNILSTEGFQSGSHYWEVDVQNNPRWDLGVALESVNRQVRVKLCPENGYWTLRLRNGNKYSAGTQPWTQLTVSTSPSRIGIFLNCEERQVSFFNADDMVLLYSFNSGPRGKVFPFFSPCLREHGQKPRAIRIIHVPGF
ncbi:hypothetical protein DNTS_029764 [Danionella cerebrum]|uniref:RING-type domain-containing protein n=1 Tax=Danionella cerebrum TaxID=2873325 RepID=A0A553PUI7_9TELE|nr:hypothetical protein DNTS_029764 [Danionella translucida]